MSTKHENALTADMPSIGGNKYTLKPAIIQPQPKIQPSWKF